MEYDEIEYDVRCPRDGALRGRADTYEKAASYAAARDKKCGKCYPEHGPHVVVRRWVTLWSVAPKPEKIND